MMRDPAEALVERIVATPAAPPLPPPLRRALGWLAALLIAGGVVLVAFYNPDAVSRWRGDMRMLIELSATLATGVIALVAAFHAAVPGRSRLWAVAPLLALAVWLGASGLGCLRNDAPARNMDGLCLVFIAVVSAVAAPLVLAALARARPLEPARVAMLGGLGVAALAAFALQFFHPFDPTFGDFALHAVAVALVVGLSARLAPRHAL